MATKRKVIVSLITTAVILFSGYKIYKNSKNNTPIANGGGNQNSNGGSINKPVISSPDSNIEFLGFETDTIVHEQEIIIEENDTHPLPMITDSYLKGEILKVSKGFSGTTNDPIEITNLTVDCMGFSILDNEQNAIWEVLADEHAEDVEQYYSLRKNYNNPESCLNALGSVIKNQSNEVKESIRNCEEVSIGAVYYLNFDFFRNNYSFTYAEIFSFDSSLLDEYTTIQEELTDLTNTTWNIPAGWTASAGYGQFNVSVQINSDGTSFLYIGYIWGGSDMPSLVSTSNRITGVMGSVTKNNSEAFSITITGGEDVTNPDLISWLQENGTIVNVELIMFTIEGQEYLAEEGMTWKEWVNTEYNTLGFYIYSDPTAVLFPDAISIHGQYADDIIVEGKHYYKEATGGVA